MGAERILNEPTGGWKKEIDNLLVLNARLVQYHNRFFKPKAKPANVILSGNLPQIALRLAQINGVLCEKIDERKNK